MLTNDVYGEPAVGVAQISIPPHALPPLRTDVDELRGKISTLSTLFV